MQSKAKQGPSVAQQNTKSTQCDLQETHNIEAIAGDAVPIALMLCRVPVGVGGP